MVLRRQFDKLGIVEWDEPFFKKKRKEKKIKERTMHLYYSSSKQGKEDSFDAHGLYQQLSKGYSWQHRKM